MKVLFVNPPTTTCLEVTKTGKQYLEENIGNKFFPLSKTPFEVMYKLNKIRDIEQDVILLDYEWYKNPNLSKEDLIEVIVSKSPDVILTTLIAQASADTLDWVTTKLKKRLPNLIILVGGQAIAHLQEKVFNFCPNIDFAIIGNADKQLASLIEKIFQGKKDFECIGGLVYKRENKIIKNNIFQETLITYGKEIYVPYESLLKEVVETVKKKDAVILSSEEFSKGCPYQCSFCAAKRKYQEKETKKVVQLLDYLCSLGIFKFYLEDLTFGVNQIHRKEMLKELKKLKCLYKQFGFRCVTRADIITKEFINNLIKSGCYEVGIGIECNDGAIINSMNKNISINKNFEALEILGKSGISFKLFLIEGYPGSNSDTSKKVFELLNWLESKRYSYFIQPALNRDIIPSQERFKNKEEKGLLKRGTTNQLDFRHDCRNYGWDSERTIRAICLLMLAYPSTELGKENKDEELQKRILLDVPFKKEGISNTNLIEFLTDLKGGDKLLRIDLAHYIEGVYTKIEIKERLKRIHTNLSHSEINKELDYYFDKLEKAGLIDSFGNPNLHEIRDTSKNKTPFNKAIQRNMILFWNGDDQRYIYAPLNKKIIKIKNCFYKDIPEEVFEFLIFFKGTISTGRIAKKLYLLFKKRKGFEDLNQARKTVQKIYKTCKDYELCN